MNEFMKTFYLDGKVAVITGGAGLYGKQLVKALAMAGATVYMASRNVEANEVVASGLRNDGYKVYAESLDLADEASILALRDKIYEKEGKVDVLVNNAVARTMKGYSDTKESWEKSMTINATGLFLITRAFGNKMCDAGSGSIINIGSYMGLLGPDYSLYEGTEMNKDGVIPDYFYTKGGMTNYTRYIASHYGRFGVRCNVLELGGLYDVSHPDSFVEKYGKATCLGRLANETDIMGTIVFMASDASAYITGAVIPVDGGYTAK
ncbi:MAG: SDR family oxidoreductase [Clostridia bacterium]|nr:SDR family oxidoreductase [Clostridia bacterium]